MSALTPAYAMNPDNATWHTCKCAKCDKAIKRQNAQVNRCEACGFCRRCSGTGQFITGTVNGIPYGPGGPCYRCNGKGFQTPKDHRRNDYYDMHRPVHI